MAELSKIPAPSISLIGAVLFLIACVCSAGVGYALGQSEFDAVAVLFSAGAALSALAIVAAWRAHERRAEESMAEANEVRKTLEEELSRAQRAGSVMGLANRIVHDFNNLITVIDGYSEIALMTLDPKHSVFNAMQEIRRASQRAADLLNQLLGLSRKHSFSPEPLNVNNVIRQAKNLIEPILGANVQLSLELSEDIHPISGDKRQLEQALINITAGVKGGLRTGDRVVIRTMNASIDETSARAYNASKPGEYVRIDVISDNRSVISAVPAAGSQRVTPEIGEVRAIVAQNGGFMAADDLGGGRASFSLFFPRGQGVVEEEPMASRPIRYGEATETVLLVEDDTAVRNLARRFMRDAGYTVLEAASAEEALIVYEGEAGKIDVLVTDIVLPGMSGFDLAKQIRQRFPDLCALFISGHTDRLAALREVLGEGNEFQPKPFTAESLLTKIENLLHRMPLKRAANA